MLKNFPLFRLWAIVQVAMLAKRHFTALSGTERRRLLELGRRPHKLSPKERAELKRIAAKLEPAAFAKGAVRHVSPFPGRRFGRR